MGLFVGSVHIKGGKASEILPGLNNLNKIHGTKFMLEEAPDGWCSVFPENYGQDAELCREVMKLTPCPAINLTVHDSDILYIDIYDGRSFLQVYNNNPTYFGEKLEPAEVEAMKAFPSGLLLFVPSTMDLEKIKTLFGPMGESPVVDDALRRISVFLGIPQAQYSYEHIEMGEYVSAARRAKLLTVPDKSVEKAGEAALKEEVKKIKKKGILIYEKKGGPWHGGRPFLWKTDPITRHIGIFYSADSMRNHKLVWSSGEFNLQPADLIDGFVDRDLGYGYVARWDKDRRIYCLLDETGKTLQEFPEGYNIGRAEMTPDKRVVCCGGGGQPKWFDLSTKENGSLDSQGVLSDRANLFWAIGPKPLVGMAKGSLFALHDWTTHQLLGFGRPVFPQYTEELLSKCLWRKESPERWEQMENFILQFRPGQVRRLGRFYFDPQKRFVFLSDGHFLGKFATKDILEAKGEEIVPEWALFFTGCPADQITEFTNHGGCGFHLEHDPASGLWIFGDMTGVLRALDPETGKVFRFLEMPRKLKPNRLEIVENGKYLIVNGLVPKGYLKDFVGLQVYDMENLYSLKQEDSAAFIVLKSNK